MNHINEPDRSIIIDAIFTSIVLGLISNLRESCCVDFATSNNNIKHPSENKLLVYLIYYIDNTWQGNKLAYNYLFIYFFTVSLYMLE